MFSKSARANVVAAFMFIAAAASSPPSTDQKPEYARWMASSTTWGYLSTISTRTEATVVGAPFGNPYSFSTVNGTPYFFASDLDASCTDLFVSTSPKANPRATFAISEASIMNADNTATFSACQVGVGFGDPENPPCARLVLSGVMSKVDPNSTEQIAAHNALFADHPSFKNYPSQHSFYIAKMSIDAVWLINAYGGAADITPADYFAAAKEVEGKATESTQKVQANLRDPPFWKEPETARWMVKELNWGVLSTVSTRSDGSKVGDAFGNPGSFAEVNGVPYFYVSKLDASMIDVFSGAASTTRASLALSEAALNMSGKIGILHAQACKIGTYLGDPENPPCARLQLAGTFSAVAVNSTEETTAKEALFAKHPSFKNYPASHDFFVGKLNIDGVWVIAMYGGAGIISPSDYFNADPNVAITMV